MARKKRTLCEQLRSDMYGFPASFQYKVLSRVSHALDKDERSARKEITDYLMQIREPRLVTHIDVDGLVSGILMYAANPKKYKQVMFTDYVPLNAGRFSFLPSDDVVDLPQPRNPVLNEEGNPLTGQPGIIFDEIVTNFWSDHHETGKRGAYEGNHVFDPSSPSCASLLYRHFLPDFPKLERFKELIDGTDMVDSASYRTPESPYDMSNPAIVLRLMFTSRSQKKTMAGFRESIISDCASPRNDWRYVINQPLILAMANESLSGYETYREYARPIMSYEHGVVIKNEEKRRPNDTGIKDRYYPFVEYPDSLFLLESWANTKDKRGIMMSENMLKKGPEGEHPSMISLGQCIREITERITGSSDAGGHKGIGVSSSVPIDKFEEVYSACKALLYTETKRLGYY